MDKKTILNNILKGNVFSHDVISSRHNSGTFTLSSGKTAGVVTDERFSDGDSVLMIRDKDGKNWIISGRK